MGSNRTNTVSTILNFTIEICERSAIRGASARVLVPSGSCTAQRCARRMNQDASRSCSVLGDRVLSTWRPRLPSVWAYTPSFLPAAGSANRSSDRIQAACPVPPLQARAPDMPASPPGAVTDCGNAIAP